MKKTRLFLLAVLAQALALVSCSESAPPLTSPAAPAASGSTSARRAAPDIPVSAVIEHTDSAGLPADLSSDGLGSYAHGAGGVSSLLVENGYDNIPHGDWQFDSGARSVGNHLDPEDALQPGDVGYLVAASPPYWGTQTVPTGIKMKCTFVDVSMLAMAAGSTITCPMLRHFTYNGTAYGLQTARSFTGWQDTTDVQVVCNSANATGCNNWTIEPIAQGRAVGRLMTPGAKRTSPNVHIGSFHVRFRIRVTRP